MGLIHGKIIKSPKERNATLETLKEDILATLTHNTLDTATILNACDTLSKAIGEEHIALLKSVGVPSEKATEYIYEAKILLSKESLLTRLKIELGDKLSLRKSFFRKEKGIYIQEKLMPLGTLLHIAAGNQYGLAFYSVIEGLLTGNINIVKLPSKDDGISTMILLELLKIEPLLQEYVYLFKYTSEETEALKTLMDIADAVVVWGSDQAIQSIRRIAEPTTKIIEWGHKLSFAYVTTTGIKKQMLKGLAENIIQTNQLLCSSCQGIYLDTDSMEEVHHFCEEFLPVLESLALKNQTPIPLEIQAQTGLKVYMERLQAGYRPCKVFQGKYTALLAYEDSSLETSILYGNCWVKRLPRERIISSLRRYKSHLQTTGLLCLKEDREELTQALWAAGVVRVTDGKNMSDMYNGAAHDGEYTLRRYTRIVSQELLAE